MDVGHYSRNSFLVDAVRVTEENMAEVAEWCKGEIHDDAPERNPTQCSNYIKVHVDNPLTVRQTTAFVGDWVLYAGKGYKVYTNKAFVKSFSLTDKPFVKSTPLDDMEAELAETTNVFKGTEVLPPGTATSVQNPGGTPSV